MKVQEVLKAMAGRLKWWEATEMVGVSDRTMRRWRQRYQENGYDGLFRAPAIGLDLDQPGIARQIQVR